MRAFRRAWRRILLLALVLGAGIGTTAAMLSLIDVFLFRPPAHVTDPQRILRISGLHGYGDYQLTTALRTLDVAGYRRVRATVALGDDRRDGIVECVTDEYFRVLDTSMLVGRPLGADSAQPEAVVSYRFARSVALDGDVIGRIIRIGNASMTIVGVAHPGFSGLDLGAPLAWVLLEEAQDACTAHGSLHDSERIAIIGRLKTGTSPGDVDGELRAVAGARSGDGPSPFVRRVDRDPAGVMGRERRITQWATGAAILLLLITCANYAGLLALQTIKQRRDLAVQRQMGATRLRIFVLLAREQVLVVTLGSAFGFVVATMIAGTVQGSLPIELASPAANVRTLILLVAVGFGAGFPCAVIPAVRASRFDILEELRSAEPTSTQRSRGATGLLIIQTALAFTLILSAGLMARSADNLAATPGYAIDELVAVTLDYGALGYVPDETQSSWLEALSLAARGIPRVQSVSLTSGDLLNVLRDRTMIIVRRGTPGPPEVEPAAGLPELHAVSAGYFDTLGTRVLRGREFSEADSSTAPLVAMLDSASAQRLFGEEPAVGQCVFLGSARRCVVVVGIVEARRQSRLTEPSREVFIPLSQRGQYRFSYTSPRMAIIRISPEARTSVDVIARTLRARAPAGVAVDLHLLSAQAEDQLHSWRLASHLFGLFGAAGGLMGALGLYASLSFAVQQRRREIAIKLALGAKRLTVIANLCKVAIVVTVGGIAFGLVVIRIFADFATWLLYGVAPLDARTVGQTSALLLLAASAGAIVPAIRATRIDLASCLKDT